MYDTYVYSTKSYEKVFKYRGMFTNKESYKNIFHNMAFITLRFAASDLQQQPKV